MHRLKRWINEAVSSYEEQLKENPIETIAISLSWVFVIIIGWRLVSYYLSDDFSKGFWGGKIVFVDFKFGLA